MIGKKKSRMRRKAIASRKRGVRRNRPVIYNENLFFFFIPLIDSFLQYINKMKVLPIVLILSLLSVAQGRRDNIRHQIRRRDALLQSVDIAGMAKSGGTGAIGAQTQLLHTLGNMIEKVPILKPDEPPKNPASAPPPTVITGFGASAGPETDSTAGTEGAGHPGAGTATSQTRSDTSSSVSSSGSGGGDGQQGNRNEKRSGGVRFSLRKATE